MASEAPIVRSAIMAFAAMQMQRSGMGSEVLKTDWRPIYDTAARQLSAAIKLGIEEAESTAYDKA